MSGVHLPEPAEQVLLGDPEELLVVGGMTCKIYGFDVISM
jgi:hypothetical protein